MRNIFPANGPKLAPSKAQYSEIGGAGGGPGEINFQKTDMHMLASQLARALGRIVLDQTGLTGEYDFKLQWTPDENPQPSSDSPEQRSVRDPQGPSLFTAVQQQLGLRLEATKGPVEVVVIDHIERPSEN